MVMDKRSVLSSRSLSFCFREAVFFCSWPTLLDLHSGPRTANARSAGRCHLELPYFREDVRIARELKLERRARGYATDAAYVKTGDVYDRQRYTRL